MTPSFERAKTVVLCPSVLGAWRGLWSFTWRTQVTWRRLPLTLLGLLVLPVMIYLTTPSPDRWARHHSWAGDPALELRGFARRLTRGEVPLKPDQQSALQKIFAEEISRADDQLSNASSDIEARRELVRGCFRRIRERAQPVLDERQRPQFQSFVKLKLDQSLNRVSETLWGRTDPFYHWLIDLYFFVILPLNCVRACGGLIQDELQADTLGFLTTRPVSRSRLLVLKFLSQTIWLQLLMLAQALLLFLAGALRDIPGLASMLPLFLVVQFLAVPAWSALGLFLGQVSKRYMALAFVYGLIVEMGIGRIPTNINSLSLMRHLKVLLAHDPGLQTVFVWTGGGVLVPLAALLTATILFLVLAAVWFSFKEHHRAAEMQK